MATCPTCGPTRPTSRSDRDGDGRGRPHDGWPLPVQEVGMGLMRQGPEALGPLFQPAAPTPAQAHSRTSVEAAKRISGKSHALRAQVLAFIEARGELGATDEEVQLALAMGGSTQRPRRVDLESAGLVRDSGRTRRTTSGRQAVVWVAA